MAGKTGPETEDSAEKAYAAASEAIVDPQAVEFPSKAKRSGKPRVVTPVDLPGNEAPNSASIAKPLIPAALVPALPEEEPVVAVPTPAAKPTKVARKAPAVRKTTAAPPAPARKTAAPVGTAAQTPKTTTVKQIPSISQLKDKIMATQNTDYTQSSAYTPGADFTQGFKTAIADAQDKAKAAFEKGTSAFGEVTEFAKGNVEAAVESGKILASGLQELGSAYVADGKSVFETLTADAKELAAVKTPVDFFKLHGELARRNFDTAVAFGSKNSEAMMKLATEAFAPLSRRVNVAVDKIKQVA